MPASDSQFDLSGATGLVIGSEGHGLSRLVRDTCDAVLSIPMAPGAVQSLNASVAGSLVVYEAFRQRIGSSLPDPRSPIPDTPHRASP